MSKRILFSICGIGLGHSHRSYRLIRGLEEYGYDIYVVTGGDGLPFFKNYLYPLYNVERMEFEWKDVGLSVERTVALSFRGFYKQYKQFVREYKLAKLLDIDLIVSDSETPPLFMSRLLNIPSIVITNQLAIISNYNSIDKLLSSVMPKIWGLANSIIIPDLPPPYTITYKNNVYPLEIFPELRDKVSFIGQIIDMDSIDIYVKPHDERNNDVYILVSGPFHDRKIFSRRMIHLSILLSSRYKTYVSLGDSHLSFSYSRRNLAVFGWVDDTLGVLEDSRLVIVRGGQTSIFESILRGTPILVIPPKGQTEQLENASRVKMLGIGDFVEPDKSGSFDYIMSCIDRIFSDYQFYVDNVLKVRRILLSCGGLKKAVMEVKKLIV